MSEGKCETQKKGTNLWARTRGNEGNICGLVDIFSGALSRKKKQSLLCELGQDHLDLRSASGTITPLRIDTYHSHTHTMSQAIGKTALAYARVWHLVDAKQRVLGRMSVGIAETLMGKHKPIYDPACNDLLDLLYTVNSGAKWQLFDDDGVTTSSRCFGALS